VLVEDTADALYRKQADPAGPDVDLAGAQVGGIRQNRPVLGPVPTAGLQTGRHPGRQVIGAEVGDIGDLGQRQGGRRSTADLGSALDELDLLRRDPQVVRGDRDDPFP